MPLKPRVAKTTGGMHPTTRSYPLAAAQDFEAGDIVHLNASQDVIETVAADPTPILGLAEEGAADVVHLGFVLVTVFTTDVVIAIEGTVAPVLDDINKSFGLVRNVDGSWTLDHAEVLNTRLFVVEVDLENDVYLCKVLDTHRQSPE